MGTNLEPTRLRIDDLSKRLSYLEGVVAALMERIAELENNFDEYVDEELIEKLDFHR
jgi:predicted nuclease with TOPRIM domain